MPATRWAFISLTSSHSLPSRPALPIMPPPLPPPLQSTLTFTDPSAIATIQLNRQVQGSAGLESITRLVTPQLELPERPCDGGSNSRQAGTEGGTIKNGLAARDSARWRAALNGIDRGQGPR
ncbi:hypothetical protein BaRGS_00036641 [Batillaria attramentaria]|uniref:Uncharacterized protein n=1 Tax=Batillaria attramentaria TaxID=370345 RepID=A0ABD0JBB5_9CAEN